VQALGIDDALAIASLVLDMDPRALVGATKLGPLDSALHAPFAGYGDVELYPESWQKCAVLGSRICRNHPFPDGNKRVAFLAMRVFARINGANWEPPHDTGPMIAAVAAREVDEEAFAEWLRLSWT
jgi:death-on-curing protein